MKLTYRHTLLACYTGYITQAISTNLPPLFYAAFHRQFGIPLDSIGLIAVVCFVTQLAVDLLCVKLLDRIGYRTALRLAHVFSTVGFVLLGILPFVFTNHFLGIILATVIHSIGSGLIEVTISPVVEALPGEQKARAMSMLHSFYCWGVVAVVLLSTGFLALFGADSWRYLPFIWAVVPAWNFILFGHVPLCTLPGDGNSMTVRELFRTPVFLMLIAMMICAGAAELGMAQWASLFAEVGLGVSKSVGDLLGPCCLAAMQGLGRLLYGLYGHKVDIGKALIACSCLCVVTYLMAALCSSPILSLIGCALTGLAVSIMWPGSLSLAAVVLPRGGNAMYSLAAFAGDVGCSLGPWLLGIVSTLAGGETQLRTGILAGIIFPVLMIVVASLLVRRRNKA